MCELRPSLSAQQYPRPCFCQNDPGVASMRKGEEEGCHEKPLFFWGEDSTPGGKGDPLSMQDLTKYPPKLAQKKQHPGSSMDT